MSEDMKTATQAGIDEYRNDARFRAIVDRAVSQATSEYGYIDPDHADKDAFEIARLACVAALKFAFDQDAELTATRKERDIYKELALKQAGLSPSPVFIAETLLKGNIRG